MPSSPKFRPSSPFRPASPFRRKDKACASPPNDRDAKPTSPELAFGERWNPASRPSLSMTGKDGARRQSSIQFSTGAAEAAIRKESLTPRISNTSETLQRRISSPPPPRTYQRGVSFDTFDNRDATDFSLTLNYKHKDFRYTRRSRTFLCGTDEKSYSEFALEWLIDELLDDGDEIVCLRVVEKDSKIASDASIEKLRYREEAQKLLEKVIEKNSQEEKAISLVMELAVGKVQDVFKRMIQIYEPSILIVGTRGRSLGGVQGLLPGSVSKWCLQSSPIPVIVVRPETKRLKKKKKRLADPNREAYNTVHEESIYRSHVLDRTNGQTTFVELPSATDAELEAVSDAIGVPKDLKRPKFGGALKKTPSTKSDKSSDPDGSPDLDSASPEGGKQSFFPVGYMRTLAPVGVDQAMKSPTWGALEENDDVIEEQDIEEPGRLSPNAKRKTSVGGDSTWDDDDDDLRDSPFGMTTGGITTAGLTTGGPKPKKEHSSSFSENPGWLKAILEKPEPGRRRSSAGRRL